MSDLDGEWELRRLSGLLPPLAGMRKRIRGERGETVLAGGVLGLPFRVHGLELRYRSPLGMVVDVLDAEPAGDVRRGSWTVFGRTLGRFELRRVSSAAREPGTARSRGSRAAPRASR